MPDVSSIVSATASGVQQKAAIEVLAQVEKTEQATMDDLLKLLGIGQNIDVQA